MDQSKKTMRHFYCRDVLWETFEQMANDFDCSIDYLVNEAMRYYARSKNYQSPGAPVGGPNATGGPSVNNSSGPTSYPPKGANMRGNPGTVPPPTGTGGPTSSAGRGRGGPTPGYTGPGPNAGGGSSRMNAGGGPGAGAGMNGPSVDRADPIRPQVNNSGSGGPMGSAGPTLFLIYNGQRYPVTKDQFIIGRGSKTSDLPIKDGNISRKHAAVIRRNGTFYIKDLGSTNGIDYKGMRIDNKRIDEGDVFHLCDYELRFTYRTD